MTAMLDIFAAIGMACTLFALLIAGLLWAVNPPAPRGSRHTHRNEPMNTVLMRLREPSFYASLSVVIAAIGAAMGTHDWTGCAGVVIPALIGVFLPSGATAVQKVNG